MSVTEKERINVQTIDTSFYHCLNMKKNTIITFIILLISCNNAKDYDNNVPKLDMIGSKEICFDSLVFDIECFMLIESGIDSYWQIIESDDFFYLRSFSDISVHKKSGEHVRTITSHIRSSQFIPHDMLVNEKVKQLWVLEQFENINKYNLDGRFIEQQKLPFRAFKIAPAGTDHFLFFEGVSDKMSPTFLRIVSSIP